MDRWTRPPPDEGVAPISPCPLSWLGVKARWLPPGVNFPPIDWLPICEPPAWMSLPSGSLMSWEATANGVLLVGAYCPANEEAWRPGVLADPPAFELFSSDEDRFDWASGPPT